MLGGRERRRRSSIVRATAMSRSSRSTIRRSTRSRMRSAPGFSMRSRRSSATPAIRGRRASPAPAGPSSPAPTSRSSASRASRRSLTDVDRHARRDDQAGRRGDPRHGARRRAGAGARLPLSRRRAVGAARPAGGEARPAAGRRRHAAPAARHRRGRGAPHDRQRRADLRRGGAAERARGRDWRTAISSRPRSALPAALGRSGTPAAAARRRRESSRADRADRSRFEAAAAELTKRARGLRAPRACVEAVRAALDLPFDEGLARERALFEELVAGDQSKAQRHLFFAEREAAKIAGPAGRHQAARDRARRGDRRRHDGERHRHRASPTPAFAVTLIETTDEALQRGLDGDRSELPRRREARAARPRTRRSAGSRSIEGGVGLDEAADADLVIEAVFEDMALKQQVFRRARPDRRGRTPSSPPTPPTSTSTRSPRRPAGRPRSPACTSSARPTSCGWSRSCAGATPRRMCCATLVALARRLGKVAGRRRQLPRLRRQPHAPPAQRRRRAAAARRRAAAGDRCGDGRVRLSDGAARGEPISPASTSAGACARPQGCRAEIADALCERGRFGQKTGKGFYRYEPGSRAPLPDPEVEALIVEASRRLGIARRAIAQDEIVERLLFPMINEGARILEEGIAARPGDIDVIWANGYGFPVWRGGPMYCADTHRARKHPRSARRLGRRSRATQALAPAPLLERLAAEGTRLRLARGLARSAPQDAEA